MQVKKQQLELDMKQQTGSKSERSTSRLYIVTLLIKMYAEYIVQNARLDESQAGIKMLGEILITSYKQMTPPLWQKGKRN